MVDVVISRVIKKPLAARLSQVIYKAVSGNRVRSEAGRTPRKRLLLDGGLLTNRPAFSASELNHSQPAGIFSLIRSRPENVWKNTFAGL